MSISRKLMTAAGGGEATYVDDVFSTYLYEGTGATNQIVNGIQLGDIGYGTSTRFDGVSDGLVRSSDLTGNANSKEFTFSAWVKAADSSGVIYGAYDGTDSAFLVEYNATNERFTIFADGGSVFAWQTPNGTCPPGIWYHLLVSGDLSDPTNKRHIYVNDAVNEEFNISNNAFIEFSQADHRVGRGENAFGFLDASIAHLYLDHTYRDLSIESNRRLFNDGAGAAVSSSSLVALSPILYLPMADGDTTNSGTGGDFAVEGSPSLSDTGVEVGEGKGGLVWIKNRVTTSDHALVHSGASNEYVSSNSSSPSVGPIGYPFVQGTATGFNINIDAGSSLVNFNTNGSEYVSWTFAKQEGFFDVVTYTGNDVAGREIPHNLGSEPGMIMVKRLTGSENWQVFHKDLSNPLTKLLVLNTDAAASNQSTSPQFPAMPTDAVFSVGDDTAVNYGGALGGEAQDYVAYLFAHDAPMFGPNGDESIIKCGSYVGNGSDDGPEIDLGWEPQWLLVKNATASANWNLIDTMRGTTPNRGYDNLLYPNTADAEETWRVLYPTATGFKVDDSGSSWNGLGNTHIYMAIRRPHKPAEEFEPDELFAMDSPGNTSGGAPKWVSGFPVDMAFFRDINSAQQTSISTRMLGARYLQTNDIDGNQNDANATFDHPDGFYKYIPVSDFQAWMFKRAPGFFDVVTQDATIDHMFPHNLGVPPEMIWLKASDAQQSWSVYAEPFR